MLVDEISNSAFQGLVSYYANIRAQMKMDKVSISKNHPPKYDTQILEI